jgi:hypothetical protein
VGAALLAGEVIPRTMVVKDVRGRDSESRAVTEASVHPRVLLTVSRASYEEAVRRPQETKIYGQVRHWYSVLVIDFSKRPDNG